jgi:hypothetical protein
MARKDVEVVIYDTVVTAMSQPGGMVWKWANQKSQRTRTTARRMCPVRTGRLRSTVDSFYEGSTRDQVKVGVSAGGPEAPYAKFVIFGTAERYIDNRIYPQNGKGLGPLPASANHKGRYRAWVTGQDANDFLSDALEEVMATL